MSSDLPFWEQPEQVERFAEREPDHRLVDLLDEMSDLDERRVLDLGCAGGRNTALIAERGCVVWAVDTSRAMVERTRERLIPIIGDAAATHHVIEGSMVDLSRFADGLFDLVVALGIYHNASSHEEWMTALSETARVLAPGGSVLVAAFTPETDLTGEGVTPVPGEESVYDGFPVGRAVLVDAATLDAAMANLGMETVQPSETVTAPTETGRRVTVNAFYRKS